MAEGESTAAEPVSGVLSRVRDAYGVALLLVLASVLGLIAAGDPAGPVGMSFAVLFQALALSVTLRVSGARRRTMRIAIGFVLSLVAVAVIAGLFGGVAGTVAALLLWLFFVVGTVVAIAKRLSQYRTINMAMVLGLLTIYLLLGLAFGVLYALIDRHAPGSFTMDMSLATSVYYSFITLATVGYGDVSPVGDIARSVAVAEAILGQLYLVSVVSLAVSRLGTTRVSQ